MARACFSRRPPRPPVAPTTQAEFFFLFPRLHQPGEDAPRPSKATGNCFLGPISQVYIHLIWVH
eukprot:9353986-Karenia_brevis.AAC.1